MRSRCGALGRPARSATGKIRKQVGERANVTMVIQHLRCMSHEVRDKTVSINKDKTQFLVSKMDVVAISRFVVLAQCAGRIHHKREPLLVAMEAGANRFGYRPHDQFDERHQG
jgi:hypothetical protein